MLVPYAEAHANPPLLELGTRSLAMFDDYVSRVVADTGRPVEYARNGSLEVALDEKDLERLETAQRILASYGVPAELLDAHALRDSEPQVTPVALGALLTRSHGFVGVDSLMQALVERARLAGARFESPIEAVSLESLSDRVEIRTHDGQYTADAAVLATGSWSHRVRVKHVAAFPVRPVRGQLLRLHWATGQQPSRIVWGPGCYTVPWSSGAMLVGATLEEVGFDESATVDGVNALTAAVSALLPNARDARLEGVRVGLRPVLPDGLPAIGPIARAPRVVVATGHYRNGVLLAPLTADLVARHVLDGDVDPAFRVTSPDRFC
jgi:glycine oxidase